MASPDDRPSPRSSRGLVGAIRIAATRLRFLAVFAVVFVVLGSWETIRAYWARWTTSPSVESATSSDTEFFCPMDPGVLSDWPSKCPVCNMTLVRRKRGEAVPLPDGVMARMQLSPYRLWLGGIGTTAIDYAPLARVVELPGVVAEVGPKSARVEAEAFARERDWIEPGQAVEVVAIGEEGRATPSTPGTIGESIPGSVEPGGVARLAVTLAPGSLRVGDRVRVRVACPVERLEPFRSLPSTPPPLNRGEARRLFTCHDHPEVVRDAAGPCPRDGLALMPRPLRDDQRVRFWCPMHPGVAADRPGSKCEACGGMVLVPRVVSYRPPGNVLAVPSEATIDDGTKTLVYVERGPGMFDARLVVLGPRCGASFPVVSGLEPGERVAAQGAFLIDAETRLNPSLAAGYFGAGEVTSAARPAANVAVKESTWLEGLTEADRPAALRQKTCPVTGKALGSMGVPPRVNVRGRAVFLCCDGCVPAIESNPEKYLAKLPGATP